MQPPPPPKEYQYKYLKKTIAGELIIPRGVLSGTLITEKDAAKHLGRCNNVTGGDAAFETHAKGLQNELNHVRGKACLEAKKVVKAEHVKALRQARLYTKSAEPVNTMQQMAELWRDEPTLANAKHLWNILFRPYDIGGNILHLHEKRIMALLKLVYFEDEVAEAELEVCKGMAQIILLALKAIRKIVNYKGIKRHACRIGINSNKTDFAASVGPAPHRPKRRKLLGVFNPETMVFKSTQAFALTDTINFPDTILIFRPCYRDNLNPNANCAPNVVLRPLMTAASNHLVPAPLLKAAPNNETETKDSHASICELVQQAKRVRAMNAMKANNNPTAVATQLALKSQTTSEKDSLASATKALMAFAAAVSKAPAAAAAATATKKRPAPKKRATLAAKNVSKGKKPPAKKQRTKPAAQPPSPPRKLSAYEIRCNNKRKSNARRLKEIEARYEGVDAPSSSEDESESETTDSQQLTAEDRASILRSNDNDDDSSHGEEPSKKPPPKSKRAPKPTGSPIPAFVPPKRISSCNHDSFELGLCFEVETRVSYLGPNEIWANVECGGACKKPIASNPTEAQTEMSSSKGMYCCIHCKTFVKCHTCFQKGVLALANEEGLGVTRRKTRSRT